MKNILIFGSCVTRDCFTEDACEQKYLNEYKINEYFARSSVVSQLSSPISIKGQIALASSFQKRMVADDFEKRFLPYLEKVKKEIDYLLIDFVEERFDIIALANSYVTYSTELKKSKLLKNYSCKKIKRKNLDPIYFKCLPIFFEKILQHLSPEQIIVHKVFFVSEYIVNNQIKKMPKYKNLVRLLNLISFCKERVLRCKTYRIACSGSVDECNQRLKKTYDYIAHTHPGIKMIEAETKNRMATPFHKWNMAPMHFISLYYKEIFLRIDQICNNPL